MRLLLSLLVIVAVAAFFAGCAEPTPAELSVTATMDGAPHSCRAIVWNSKGVQIKDENTDIQQGVVFITGLEPGKYKITFKDSAGKDYAAIRWVTLKPGDTQNMPVDLNLKDDPNYAE
jgi:hypothetical protein